MDIDDNDAQDQNLQLVGEANSKVTPVLRPYALPKFEFDDSLQGHLRFDSLVENEVFLGITSQEDNHWIEEYSRGTSEIQFSSSVVESSRKNVWSEATSSESVEMLLKSVGQEEKVVQETVNEEFDACEPGSLTNIMDTNPNLNENFVESKVSSDCEPSLAKFESQSQETQVSSRELDLVVIGEKVVDKVCDGVHHEANKIANESSVNELQEQLSVSKVECGNAGSSRNVDASVEECQENPRDVPQGRIEDGNVLVKNLNSSEPDHIIENEEISMCNLTHSSTVIETSTYSMEKVSDVLNVESVDNQPVEGSIPVDEEPSVLLAIESCDMQIDERHNARVCSTEQSESNNTSVSASLICSKINEEPNDNMHDESLAVSPNSGCIETQAGEDSDMKSKISDSSKSNVAALSSPFHMHSHSVEETESGVGGNLKSEIGEGTEISNVGETLLTSGSSAEMPSEYISNKDESAGNNASKTHTEDSNGENHIVQVGDEIRSSDPDAIAKDQGATYNEKHDARLPLDFRDMGIDVVGTSDSQKNVEPSSPFEVCEGVIAIGQGSESDIADITDAVTAVDSSKIPSPDTPDGVQLPSGTVATVDDVNEDQPRSPILGVSLVHNDNEGKVEVGSSKKVTPEVDSTLDCASDGPLPVVEKDNVSDGVEKVVHELAGHCDSPVGNLNASPSNQTTEDNQSGLKCSKTVETSSIPGNSAAEGIKNADEGGLVVPRELTGEDEVEPLNLAVNTPDEQKASVDVAVLSEHDTIHEVQNGCGSVSLDKPQIFSCSDTIDIEHSQSVKGNQEATEGFLLENFPLSKASCVKDGLQPVSSSSPTKEEKSFTFKVNANAGQNLSSTKNTKESSVSSCASPLYPVKLHEHIVVSPETPISAANEAVAKKTSERKPRRKSVGRESSKKGTQSKETTPTRRSQVEKPHASLTPPPATGHVTPAKDSKPNEGIECSNLKSVGVPPSSISAPELNNSTSLFLQSFTDNQQVQLRAQILVYGSLISGASPDEPHMIAAFGQSDGGRRTWEAAWHACLERVRGQKSIVNNPGTPTQSRSGNKDSDQEIKLGSAQSKVISSPTVSPMIPISSPLWNISTPYDAMQASAMPRSAVLDYRQALSPLHPYQSPQMQNIAGHNPSWLSQGPFPGQWVATSPVAPFNARFSALPITESVKLTTVKESGVPGIPVIPVNPGAGPTISSVPPSLSSIRKATVSSGQPSSDSKSRKRKKAAASQIEVASHSTPVAHFPWAPHTEGYNQISFPSQNQTNSGTALVVTSQPPTSAPLLTPVSVIPKINHGQLSCADENIEKSVTREEIVSKIEQSKVQATDAAVHAAAAVSHCQTVWSQLETQKNSGLVSDDEAKLASSAVSIAAASSVAKVAAAAAKIASNVAEQARLMADEVFRSSRIGSYDQSIVISHDKSTSIISAAREAARRRIEAASVASKHAENLDAIVKAAELAAEAVSQAGKIVAMGNPSALTKLVEAGPEGYWKTSQSSNQQGYSDKRNVETAPNDKEIQTLKQGLSLQENSRDLSKNQMIIIDGISGSGTSYENDKSTRVQKGPALSKAVGVIPGPVFGSDGTLDVDHIVPQSTSGSWKENIIEGSFVEVYKDDNKNVGAWFAANILTLKDGKALVCYTEIQSDDGSGKLEEWVPLEVEGTEAPRIRVAHPMTTMRFEGTRKRGRTALTDNAWCSGDRVDVWVHDRWCEAVVVETNKIDVTSLTVQFPAQEKTSVARSWHVRPTLMWKDGKWIEWSSLKGCRSSEGDTPHEKRQKFGNPVVEGKEKGNISSIVIDLVEPGRRALPLSGPGSLFDVGKSSRNENKFNTQRTMKSGMQKERSRVVFGVPKPGKKQKFVNVSTHYVADGSNPSNTPNDSDKVTSYSVPRGLKDDPKNDAKEKQVAEVKSKVHKPRKPPIPLLRPLTLKDKSKTSKSTSHEASLSDKNVKDSVGDDENFSGHENRMDFGSSSNTQDAEESLTSKAISQRLNKRKVAPGNRKTTKIEVKDQSTSEVEPRRSNRKMQPTSRLLEGLQSSLTISKMPTVSHASQRSHNKVTPKGSTNSG